MRVFRDCEPGNANQPPPGWALFLVGGPVRLFEAVLWQIVGGNAEAPFKILGRIILTGNWGELNGHLLFRRGLQQERHDPILR